MTAKLKNNHRLIKEEFELIFSEDITIKLRKELLEKINKRFEYIIPKAFDLLDVKVGWYDFSNESEEANGWFDPDRYNRGVTSFRCEHDNTDCEHSFVDTWQFPNSWYYEDFEEDFLEEVANFDKKRKEREALAKKKRLEKKKKKESFLKKAAAFQESIRAKLSEEEMKYSTFRDFK